MEVVLVKLFDELCAWLCSYARIFIHVYGRLITLKKDFMLTLLYFTSKLSSLDIFGNTSSICFATFFPFNYFLATSCFCMAKSNFLKTIVILVRWKKWQRKNREAIWIWNWMHNTSEKFKLQFGDIEKH